MAFDVMFDLQNKLPFNELFLLKHCLQIKYIGQFTDGEHELNLKKLGVQHLSVKFILKHNKLGPLVVDILLVNLDLIIDILTFGSIE